MTPTGPLDTEHQVSRREFLALSAAAGGALLLQPGCGSRENAPAEAAGPALVQTGYGYEKWDEILRSILQGFVRNARATSDTFAVCDYRNGTHLENFVTAGGKTCDSVTRILPALAAAVSTPEARKSVEVEGVEYRLEDILHSALSHGTDPRDKDFWRYASPGHSDQRQVESSIVAFSLWLAGDRLLDRFTPQERKNIQDWLASCTKIEVRRNNWALFTAVNHAARLALAERWPEFSGDESFFRADLESIDRMYAGDGWYHDSLEGAEYDYYNFWVFASHTLYWDMLVGERFPDLREKFRNRLKQFLETVPYLFGANGSHILYGRSLIYRWATLTPLVLSYRLGLWPLSTGLLRRICNTNLSFLWQAGAWDEENGCLRESLTPHSSREICESYINNGHPYWGMQAFFTAGFPHDDPFWNAPEEPLPVETADFRKIIPAAGILLQGHKQSGQVEMWQARSSGHYPNKYYNFSYSSHFPFNVGQAEGQVPPDCSLAFSGRHGAYGRRSGPYAGAIVSESEISWQWKTTVGQAEVEADSRVFIDGELQWRVHKVSFGGKERLTASESTYALGLEPGEAAEIHSGGVWEHAASRRSGQAVFIRAIYGFLDHHPLAGFRGREDLNSFCPRAMQASVSAGIDPGGPRLLIAAVYASPSPLPLGRLLEATGKLPPQVAEYAGLEA